MSTDDKTGFQSLMNETSAALAEVIEVIKTSQGSQDEIAAALVEIAGALTASQPQPLDELVKALKALRITAPAITNQVNPTPVNVNVQPAAVHFMPAPDKHITWRVTIPNRYGGEPQVMLIERTQ